MVVLDDVSIQVITRNDIMNPAGGIERFVHAHIPYPKELRIQDTGSDDGTYEKLKELQKQYSNLIIPEPIDFMGFDYSRNVGLKDTSKNKKIKWIIELDTDELIKDWEELSLAINSIAKDSPDTNAFLFSPIHIFPDYRKYKVPYNSLRLFRNGSVEYYGKVFENPSIPGIKKGEIIPSLQSTFLGVAIYHFLPSYKARLKKMEYWYKKNRNFEENIKNNISPSQTPGFKEWKAYNPKRDNYN